MIKKDYILDQIEMLVKVVAKMFFKDKEGYRSILIFKSEEIGINSGFYENLIALVGKNKIDEAENILFERIEAEESIINLNTAIHFYNYLSKLPAIVLQAGDFSLDEIKEGFNEIMEIYGITDILI